MQGSTNSFIRSHFTRLAGIALVIAALLLVCAPLRAESTKTVSGKLHTVKGNTLTVQKGGTGGSKTIDIEMDEHTKVNGQVVQGMHAKIKYREEAAAGGKGEPRRIALEIETQPDRASKQAKEVSGSNPPPKKDHP